MGIRWLNWRMDLNDVFFKKKIKKKTKKIQPEFVWMQHCNFNSPKKYESRSFDLLKGNIENFNHKLCVNNRYVFGFSNFIRGVGW